jgi:Leucine-rich repeat (LRR) protein
MDMRRLFFTALLFIGAASAFAQEGDSLRLLNDIELQQEKWYYSLDEALMNPEKVYKLSLTDTKLKGGLPVEITQFKNLQILTVSNCKLKSLPAEIGELTHLQRVSLYKNKLRVLPEELRKLHNLQVLYLGKNKLTTIPMWVGGLGKLRRLDLSYNPLSPLELQYVKDLCKKVEVTP